MRLQDGNYLVKMARSVIEARLAGKPLPKVNGFTAKRGVFVTLHTFPEGELRGCIGFPYPDLPLRDALQKAAVSAALHDPRFSPVTLNEMDKVIVEISVLTQPTQVPGPAETRDTKVDVGKDGLVVCAGPYSGLLLPQVPVELGWDAHLFLCQACVKAGLQPDSWLDQRTKVYKFSAEVFAEQAPRGKIVKKRF